MLKIYENPSKLELIHIAKKILDFRHRSGKAIGVCGNGGYASQSSHLAGELIPIGVPCIPFNDISAITSIGNDLGYDLIFSKYFTTFYPLLDSVILLTTSGNSKNIQLIFDEILVHPLNCLIITGTNEDNSLVQHIKDIEEIQGLRMNWWLAEVIRFDGDTPRIQEKTLEFIHYMYKLAKGHTSVESF